jgi:hypothetical protein
MAPAWNAAERSLMSALVVTMMMGISQLPQHLRKLNALCALVINDQYFGSPDLAVKRCRI